MKSVKKIAFLFVSFLFLTLMLTCRNNVGLGGIIDINPPTVGIASPPIDAVVRNSFILKGVAEDDSKVDGITVTLKSLEIKNLSYGPFEAQLDGENKKKQWSVVINAPENGRFPIRDGKYKVSAVVKDADGKTGTTISAIIIDNTAPIFAVNRPSSFSGANSSGLDIYGAELWLKGEAADNNGVSLVRIYGYDTAQNTFYIAEEKNVSSAVNIMLDSFSSAGDSGFYKKLYGTDENAGIKKFLCGMELFDNAKEYDSPHTNGRQDIGNTDNVYYLYDALRNGSVFPNHTVQDIYRMKDGSFYIDSDGNTDEAKKAEALKIIEGLERGYFNNPSEKFKISLPENPQQALTEEAKRNLGEFGLNPLRSPKYEVVGFSPIEVNNPGQIASSLFDEFQQTKNSRMNIKISANLDGVPFADNPDFKVYLYETESYLAKLNAPPNPNDNDFAGNPGVIKLDVKPENISKQGTSYIVNINTGESIDIGKSYIVFAAGKDIENNTIIADTKNNDKNFISLYGFKTVGTEKPPVLKVIKINAEENGGQNIVKQVFVKKGDDVVFKTVVNSESFPVTVGYEFTLDGAAPVTGSKTFTQNGFQEIVIENAKLNTDGGIYTLSLTAQANNGQSSERSYSVYYDVEPPVLNVNLPGQVLEMPEIKGGIYDLGSGVNFDSFTVSYKYNDGIAAPLPFETKAKSWKLQAITPAKEGKYEIEFTVEDAIGNKLEKSYIFFFDKAKPEITEVNGTPAEIIKDGTVINFNDVSFTISGKMKESDTVKSLKIGIKNGSLSDADNLTETVSGSGEYTFSKNITVPSEGKHVIRIEAEDNAGNKTSLDVNVCADKTKPIFTDMRIAGQELSTSGNTIGTTSGTVAITGKISDGGNGSGIDKAEYKLEGAAEWKRLNGTVTGGKYVFDGFVNISLNDTKKILLQTIDKAGNREEWNCTVRVSSNTPALTLNIENTPSPAVDENNISYRKSPASIKIHGYLAAATGAEAISVEVNKDGSPVLLQDFFENHSAVESLKIVNTNNPVAFTAKSSVTEGEYRITVSGGGQSKTAVLVIDNAPPVLDVRVPAENQHFKDENKFYGSVFDEKGVGVQSITAELNSVTHQLKRTSSSWESVTAPQFNEGNNTVRFVFTDKLGNSANKTFNFTYDKNDPVLSEIKVNGQTGGQVLIGAEADGTVKNFTVEGKVQDSNSMKSVTVSVNKTGSSFIKTFPEIPKTGNALETWSQQITNSDLNGGGSYTITIKAEDASGRISVITRAFEIDKDKPEVSFEAPADNTSVNKVITVRGKANDDYGLKTVKVVRADGTGLITGSVSESSGDDSSKAEFSGAKVYNWSFKLDTSRYNDNAPLKLKVIALDKVDNKTEAELNLSVNQDSDRPVITITSFDKIAEAGLSNSRTLTGTISDDDGALSDLNQDLKIKIGSGSYAPVTFSAGGIWTYQLDPSVADGKLSIDFEVKDAAGTTFKTVNPGNPLTCPKVIGKSDTLSEAKYGNMEFNFDNTPPEIKSDDVRFVLDSTFTGHHDKVASNKIIGNEAKKKASFRVFVKDIFGIKEVKLSLGGTVKNGTANTSGNEGGYEAWDITDVQLQEGSHVVKIEVTDKSGFSNVWQAPVITDFTPPEIDHMSPSLEGIYFNEVNLTGNITDKPPVQGQAVSGVDVDTILYKVGDSQYGASHSIGSEELSKLERSVGTWKIVINDISKYKTFPGVIAPSGGPGNSIYKLPVKIKASDKAGNAVSEKTYELKFDPDGGTPIIEVLSPKQNDTIGGIVAISGLAKVANPASGKIVKELILQLSENETNFSSSWIIDSKDYGTGHTILTDNNGITYWNYPIPETVKNAILNGQSSKDVYFRLKGKGETEGDWTAPRKFTISTNVARFSEIKLKKPDNSEEAYIANAEWIKGNDFKITGKVTYSAGIKEVKAETMKPVPSGVQELDTANSSSWFTQIADGYKFEIPIKTAHYPQESGYIEFDIIATDNRSQNAVTVYSKIMLKYDNSKPVAVIGNYVVKSGSTSFTNGAFTSSVALETAKKDSYRVLVKNKVYTVDSISGASVTLQGAGDVNGVLNYGIVEKPAMIYDDGSDYQLCGIAEDSGSKVHKASAELKIDGQTVSSGEMTRQNNGIMPERGDMASFQGSLNTDAVKNGKGKLKITVYDEAGNTSEDEIDVLVKNKPLRIGNLVFRTDLSGNGTYEADEQDTASGGSLNSGRDFEGSVNVSGKFVFKNHTKSEIEIAITDGKGTEREIKLYKDSISTGNLITSATVNSNSVILDLSSGKLGTIGEGNEKKLILTVSDKPYEGDWYASMNITVDVDAVDENPPTGVILPFFYNTEKSTFLKDDKPEELTSVVYQTIDEIKKPLGHVEIGVIDSYPCVSGQVILRGIAYDNNRLKKLELSGAGINGVKAEFSNGSWTSSTGLEIKADRNKFSNTGHYVEWEYKWITGTPEKGAEVKLTVTDNAQATGNTTDLTNSVPSSGTYTAALPTAKTGERSSENLHSLTLAGGDKAEKYQFIRFVGNNEESFLVQINSVAVSGGKTAITWLNTKVPEEIKKYELYTGSFHNLSLKINIVPYITGIENAEGQGLSNSVIRGSDGSYSMNKDSSQTMIVKGFNLQGHGTTATIGGNNCTVSDITANQVKLSKNQAKSGELIISVKPNASAADVESINNKVNIDKPYNKEDDITNSSSNLWTAKRKVQFWEGTQVCSNNKNQTFYYPSMVMEGSQPIFAYCNNNDGFTYRTTSNSASAQRTGIWYARNAALAKTGDGKYIIVSNEDNFSSNDAGYLYVALDDTKQTAEIGSRGISGTGTIELCGVEWDGTVNGGNSEKRLLNRFKFPNLIVEGNRNNLQLYISYYDERQKQIQFFAFKNTNSSYNVNLSQPNDDKKIASNGNFAVHGTTGGASSEHTAMAKVDAGIYIAYYDATGRKLKLAYSKTPVDSSGLAQNNGWNTLEVDSSLLTGQYVSMASGVEGTGTEQKKYLYVAYYDAVNAALKFARIDIAAMSVTSKQFIDVYQNVGYKTGIEVIDGIPHITYYNNAYSGTTDCMKIAYPTSSANIGEAGANKDGSYTGKWQSIYIPSKTAPNVGIPEFNRVMIGADSSNTPVAAWLGEQFIEYWKMVK